MQASPAFDDFARAYGARQPVLVWTSLVADLETPVSVMLKLADGRPMSFLLESVEGGSVRGRYSIIGLKPDLVWRCRGNIAELNRRVRSDADAFEREPKPALASLKDLIAECRVETPAPLPPMASGLFGYMGYNMVGLMERLPDKNPDTLGIPDGMFLRPTIVCIFDNLQDRVTLVTPVWPNAELTARAAYDLARERLAEVLTDFERNLPYRREAQDAIAELPVPKGNMTREQCMRVVETAKEYIRAGEIFQVVPSMRFEVPFRLPPFALYRALRRLNPSPFLFFLDYGSFSVVGSSPEILVRVRDGTVTIRPLAGTRRRGADAEEDKRLAEELLADPKERAEHLMLLDLARNDVGRVAKIGTVKVTDQFTIERYSHVMHICSHVEGKLDPRYSALDALIAGFPAGTLSGAPKVRAMEIIDELETERRNLYGGAAGYFAGDGSMDTCIVVRTALVKDGKMIVQAGVGVVADSDPATEYQEILDKSRALIRAAEEAVKFARS
ncbi:MAG TPA: anthranilate synthase component I [Stellaceae bacterium]|jgi:anthranilate synthase component 1|nr:anthranilate synthase component I [Stellaceae bacterium]